MTTALVFSEDYGDPDAERRALGEEAGLVDVSDRDVLRASGADHRSDPSPPTGSAA